MEGRERERTGEARLAVRMMNGNWKMETNNLSLTMV